MTGLRYSKMLTLIVIPGLTSLRKSRAQSRDVRPGIFLL